MIRRLSSNQGGVIRLAQFYDSHMSKKIIVLCSCDVWEFVVMWVCPFRFYSSYLPFVAANNLFLH